MRLLNRIQLSRPSSTACCITEGGTTQAHTAREHVGSSARKKWTLRRMLVKVCRGADSPNPTPGTRGAIPFAHNGCRPNRARAIHYVTSDKRLWGTSFKERHATIGRDSVFSLVNRNLRGKRGVVESNDTVDEAGVMFW